MSSGMTFREFYAAVKAIAGTDYFAIQVEAVPSEITWSAYTARAGWTSKHHEIHPVDGLDPCHVLEALRRMHSEEPEPTKETHHDPAGLETVGEVAL